MNGAVTVLRQSGGKKAKKKNRVSEGVQAAGGHIFTKRLSRLVFSAKKKFAPAVELRNSNERATRKSK